MNVLKTDNRTIKTIGIGKFRACYKVFYCKRHPDLGHFHSRELAEMVAPNNNVSYDVIVDIGKLRYMENRRVSDIQLVLFEKYSFFLSISEIEILIDKFIFYLAVVHQQSNDLINEYIKMQGGYILYVDSTCEGDSPKLMSSLDSVSGFVLYSAKLKSENKDEVASFLNELKNRFGKPHAVVSDMSKGILAAVQEVLDKFAHYICHYHFLAAIGKLLFNQEHTELRNALSNAGISGELKALRLKMKKGFNTLSIDEIESYLAEPQQLGKTREATEMLAYSLILWILDHISDGNGYKFPFDQRYLYFYKRLETAQTLINEVKAFYPAKSKNDAIIWKLYHLVEKIVGDSSLKNVVLDYETKLEVFFDLRKALGIATEPAQIGLTKLSTISSAQELESIKTAVKGFMKELDQKISNAKDPKIRRSFINVKERIEKYWDKLFADPLVVEVNGEEKLLFIHRTNNLMENHFRQVNHGHRRIHGNNSVRRNLKNIPEQLPLVENLKNPNYVKLVFQNESKIAKRFSQVDVEIIRKMAAEHRSKKKVLSRKTKRILRKDDFKERLKAAFALVAA